MSRTGWLNCPTCLAYEHKRVDGPVMSAAIAEQALRESVPPHRIFVRLMLGVHARHLAGLAVLRPTLLTETDGVGGFYTIVRPAGHKVGA